MNFDVRVIQGAVFLFAFSRSTIEKCSLEIN